MVQGERNARYVEIEQLEGGSSWNILEDACLAVRNGRATLTNGYYDALPDSVPACSHSGSIINLILEPRMLAETGPVSAQMEMLLEN